MKIFAKKNINLKKINRKDFDYFYSLLEEDFCYDERKSKEDELKVFNNKKFKPCFIYEDNQIVGYFCYWDFRTFIFGEHFAILKDLRNLGYGTKVFKAFLANLNIPFVFEIEKPTDVQSKKRKKFYERLGMMFNEFDYIQPSYHQNGQEVPMIFVSYPNKLTQQEYTEITDLIKDEVYKK